MGTLQCLKTNISRYTLYYFGTTLGCDVYGSDEIITSSGFRRCIKTITQTGYAILRTAKPFCDGSGPILSSVAGLDTLRGIPKDSLVSVPQYQLSGEVFNTSFLDLALTMWRGCCNLIGRPLWKPVGSWLSLIQIYLYLWHQN